MASRFWIASNGNWNDTANWSETPTGPGGAGVPGEADHAFLEKMGAMCTLNTPAIVDGLTVQQFTLGNFTISQELRVLGNLRIQTGSKVVHLNGAGKITLAGPNNQTVHIVDAHGSLYTVTLDKSAGTVLVTGAVWLQSDQYRLRNPSQIDPRTATLMDIDASGATTCNIVGDVAARSFTASTSLAIMAGVTLDTYAFTGPSGLTVSGNGTLRVNRGQYNHAGSIQSTVTLELWGAGEPVTPANFQAVAVSSSQIDLTWDASAFAAGYHAQRSTDQTNWTDVHHGSGTSASATGLTANTLYYFQLAAYNTDMAYSNYATASATTNPNVPSAPTGLTATAASTTQINVSWNTVSGATGYRLERRQGAGSWSAVYTGPNLSYNNTGLTAGTTYEYRVFATNASGDSAASTAVSRITICAAPTGVTATPQDRSTEITISFNAVTGAASYVVEWATTSGGTYTALSSVTGTSQTHAVGTNNTERFYRVKAVNASGSSANSSVVSTKTPPAAPTNLTAAAISTTQIDVSFAAPTGATKNKIEYKPASGNTWTTAQDNSGTSVSLTGLTANTNYDIRVSSDNL